MAINKKLIHFKTKENFNNKVANNEILDTSIVFIQDSKEIHTHGTTYKSVNWSVLSYPNGIYIYDINGKYTSPSKWDTSRNDEAVGVAILTDDCKFVVAKEDIGQKAWGGYGTDISTLTNYKNAALAATDFDGVSNTSKIIAAIGNTNDGYRDGTAAGDCAAYTFPNGKTGYLGAAGEWKVAHQNKEDLNSALTLIGGTTMKESAYWTSTEENNNQAWDLWFDSASGLYIGMRSSRYYVRAFLAL